MTGHQRTAPGFLRHSPRTGTGFTLVELVVVVFIIMMVLAVVVTALSRAFQGTRKGFDTLSLMQEESHFLSYLKHDLRTLIMGDGPAIPPPELMTDAEGTVRFSFYKVETADEFGRPLPVLTEYIRKPSGKTFRGKDGQDHPLFTIFRKVGTKEPHPFMGGMIASFSVVLQDHAGQVLSPETYLQARMARITLGNNLNQLLEVTASIYSPYLPNPLPDSPETCWFPNFQVETYNPLGGVETYDDVPLDASDLEIIPGARGIALTEGM